ncbi:MAG: Uma2 family endonuclease [Acidobacteriota bacterium]
MSTTRAEADPALPPLQSIIDENGIVYPDSDGKPMAENDQQYRSIVRTRFSLELHFRDRADVYVGSDLLVYYEQGDPGKSVAPDVFLACGVPKRTRRTYLIWEEGKAPDVVFEIASPNSWRAGLGWKLGLYQGLQVTEYFLFDPEGKHFRPHLQGFRLDGRFYSAIPHLEDQRGELGLSSRVLGLELWSWPHDDPEMPHVMRLYDPASARWIPTPEEETIARIEAERRAAEEAARRLGAEARVAELEERLRRMGDAR